MGSLLKYSGITTKIRAMSAKLLTRSDFESISSMNAVTEVVEYLKSHPAYEEILAPWDKNTLHRGDVEKLFVQSMYNDYTKLYLFGNQHVRTFLKFYMKWYEVELINYCFRIVFNHYDEPFDINYKKAFFDRYSSLRIEELVLSNTEFELVEKLKDTEYYDCLKVIAETGSANLYDYNLALDLYYYKTVWKERKKYLKGKELEMYTKKCGANIDLLNLQWIYRSKKYYHMDDAAIYSLLIPINYHIRSDELKKMIETENLTAFMSLVNLSYYGQRYDLNKNLTLERIYKDCIEHLYQVDYRKSPYSMATIHRYLFLKEEEIEKLTTALECIRYGIESNELLKYVGGVAR